MSLLERCFTGLALLLGMTLFVVNPADAQSVAPREITGVVQDPQTKTPIVGAKVTLTTVDQQVATVTSGTNPVMTSATGSYSFMVTPGVYRLEVEKDGYVKSILTQSTPGGSTSAYFYTSQPSMSANLPLVTTQDAQAQNVGTSQSLFVNPDGTLTSECTTPPEVSDVFPIPNSKVKNLFPTIQFTLKKGDPTIPGLDRNCVKMFINDKEVTPTITGTDEELTVTYKPIDPVGKETHVRIEACDKSKNPNKLIKEFVFYSDAGSLYSSPEIDAKYSQMDGLIATGMGKYSLFLLVSMLFASLIVFGIYHKKRKKS